MPQNALIGCPSKTVHDVVSLFRDKSVHDVVSPDNYQQRQVFFLWLLKDVATIAVRRRAQVDRHLDVGAQHAAPIEAQAPDISSRDNAALAVASGQIVSAFVQLHDKGLIPDDELIRLAYQFAGETVDVQEIIDRASKTPHAASPQTSPHPALSPAGRGGGGETGDVAAKGAN